MTEQEYFNTTVAKVLDKKWLAKLETESERVAHTNLKDLMAHLQLHKKNGHQKRTISLSLEIQHYQDGEHIEKSCKRKKVIVHRESIASLMINI